MEEEIRYNWLLISPCSALNPYLPEKSIYLDSYIGHGQNAIWLLFIFNWRDLAKNQKKTVTIHKFVPWCDMVLQEVDEL